MKYLKVCEALYDYEAQTPDELNLHEDDIVYVLEIENDGWWKVEPKPKTETDHPPSGLVPATYLKECEAIGKVVAEYDYAAQQEEELSFHEGEEMDLFECDDPDWFVVKLKNGDFGLAPSNYVQRITNKSRAQDNPAPKTVAQDNVNDDFKELRTSPVQEYPVTDEDDIQEWSVHEYDPVKKKKRNKGQLCIGNAMISYTGRQYPVLDVSEYLFDGKLLHIEVKGAQPAVLDLSASSKSEAKAIMVKIADSSKAARAAAVRVSTPADSHSLHKQQQQPTMPQIPVQTGKRKPAEILYAFAASEPEEVSVVEGEAVTVIDEERTDDWYCVQKTNGESGLVPASYVSFHDDSSLDTEKQRRAEEEAQNTERLRQAEEDRRRQIELERQRQQEERDRMQREQQAARKKHEEEERERRRKVHEAAQRAELARTRQEDQQRKQSTSNAASQEVSYPDMSAVRTWTDNTGTFKVEAQFLSATDEKIRLHKTNGVKIDVPTKKMSEEDKNWVKNHASRQEKNVRLGASSMPSTGNASAPQSSRTASTPPKLEKRVNPDWDWFDWFMMVGIPMQQSLVYSSAFKADKLDDTDIQNLTHKMMKTLGLKEEHVQHIQRYIETGKPVPYTESDDEFSEQKTPSPKVSRRKPAQSAPKEVHPDLLEFIGKQLSASSDNDTKRAAAATASSDNGTKKVAATTTPTDLIGFNDDAWKPSPATSVTSPATQIISSPITQTQSPTQLPPRGSWPVAQQHSGQLQSADFSSETHWQQQQQQMQQQMEQLQQEQQKQAQLERHHKLQQQLYEQQQLEQRLQEQLQQQNQQMELQLRQRQIELQQQEQQLQQRQLQMITQHEQQRMQQQQEQQRLLQQQQQQQQQQQRHTWQPQQMPLNMTGYLSQPSAVTVPLSSALPPPLEPTLTSNNAAGQQPSFPQQSGPQVAQPTGLRDWQTATPENPFGSLGSYVQSPQRTGLGGVQFSTPPSNAFTQSPIQPQLPGYLQPQMTGVTMPPNVGNNNSGGPMQYGQQQNTTGYGRGW